MESASAPAKNEPLKMAYVCATCRAQLEVRRDGPEYALRCPRCDVTVGYGVDLLARADDGGAT